MVYGHAIALSVIVDVAGSFFDRLGRLQETTADSIDFSVVECSTIYTPMVQACHYGDCGNRQADHP
jgi:hypothetical protein